MTHEPNREAWFDTWLDAKLSGKLPPAFDPDSIEAGDLRSLRGATDGAGQFHALASHAERRDHGQSEQDQIWNRVLADRAKRPTPFRESRRFRPGWSAMISTLVAAVVLLAIVAGFRKFDFGDETGDSDIQFGLSGSGMSSGASIGSFAEGGCEIEPISREQLLETLATQPESNRQRAIDTMQPEQVTVSDDEIPGLIDIAEQFYTCLLEGKPMSALALTTSEFKWDWVMNQVALTYGVISDDEVTAFVDSLVQKENESLENGYEPIGTTFFSPVFDASSWIQTIDERVHLIANWETEGVQAELPSYLVHPPNTVVLDRAETGEWLIDRIGSDIVGG